MGIRERKKEATRTALIDAAMDLFLERGFDGTTVDDVAEAAGVSRRTYFRYFPSKEAAFFAEHEAQLEDFVETVAAWAPERGTWRAVCDALIATSDAYTTDTDGAVAWRGVMKSSSTLIAADLQLDLEWERRIAAMLQDDGLQPFDAAVRAGAVMGVVRATLVAWYEADGDADLVEMGTTALRRLEVGFGDGNATEA